MDPRQLTAGSSQKAYFRCPKCQLNHYQIINARVKGKVCTKDGNHVITGDRLLIKHPLFDEVNIEISNAMGYFSDDLAINANKYLVWDCRDLSHLPWCTKINIRNHGRGCNTCGSKHKSGPKINSIKDYEMLRQYYRTEDNKGYTLANIGNSRSSSVVLTFRASDNSKRYYVASSFRDPVQVKNILYDLAV